jgi:hypothetical protein
MKNGDILSGLPATLLSGHVSMHCADTFLSNSDRSLQKRMIEGLREYANKQQSSLNTASLVAVSGVGSDSVGELGWMKEAFRDLEDILHMKEIDQDYKPELLAAKIANDYKKTDKCPATTFLSPIGGENGIPRVGSGGESISGLAIDTLVRFENELNTALTLWDNTSQTRQVKQKKLLGFFGNEVLSTLKAPPTHFDYAQPPSTSSSFSASSGRSFTSYYSGVGRNSVGIGIGGSRVGSGGVGGSQTSRAYVKKNLTVFFGEAGIEEEIVVLKNNKLSSFFGVIHNSSKPKSPNPTSSSLPHSSSPPSFGGTVTPNNTSSPTTTTTTATTQPNIKSTGTQIDRNTTSASLNSNSDWLRKKPSPNRASSPYV